MLTLERLVELRSDKALMNSIAEAAKHCAHLLGTEKEIAEVGRRAMNGEVIYIDRDELHHSTWAVMLAIYELGYQAGIEAGYERYGSPP